MATARRLAEGVERKWRSRMRSAWLAIVGMTLLTAACTSSAKSAARPPVVCSACVGNLRLDLSTLVASPDFSQATDLQVCRDGSCVSYTARMRGLAKDKSITMIFGGRDSSAHTMEIRLIKGTQVVTAASTSNLVLPPIPEAGNSCGCPEWLVTYDPSTRSLTRSPDPIYSNSAANPATKPLQAVSTT